MNGDFIIYDGSITIKILERIRQDNAFFGLDFSTRTKKIGSFFKEEFKKMRNEIEDANYFKKNLVNSFDYKEKFVIDAIKKDLNNHLELYFELNKHIDSRAKILHLGDDFGQLDVLLVMQEPQRKVDSFISTETAHCLLNLFLLKVVILNPRIRFKTPPFI